MRHEQKTIFDGKEANVEVNKSYRAIRHDAVRAKQNENANEVHHPDQKINQIKIA